MPIMRITYFKVTSVEFRWRFYIGFSLRQIWQFVIDLPTIYNIMSSILHLLSTKITGCLPANVLKLFLETLAGSTTGFSGFEAHPTEPYVPGFYGTCLSWQFGTGKWVLPGSKTLPTKKNGGWFSIYLRHFRFFFIIRFFRFLDERPQTFDFQWIDSHVHAQVTV